MTEDRPSAGEDKDTLERLIVNGEVKDILTGDNLAWECLNSSLGGDDPNAWWLAEMTHAFVEPGKISFNAVFKRDQSFPTPTILRESDEIRESRERAMRAQMGEESPDDEEEVASEAPLFRDVRESPARDSYRGDA